MNDLKGCTIGATDDEIGHAHAVLVDEDSWAIHYLVADTSNWWLGHQVLIPLDEVNDTRGTSHAPAGAGLVPPFRMPDLLGARTQQRSGQVVGAGPAGGAGILQT